MTRLRWVAVVLSFTGCLSSVPSIAQQFADADCGTPIGDHLGVPARSNAADTNSHRDCGDRPRGPNQPYPTTSVDGDPFQCPEYIRRFYREALGLNTSGWRMDATSFFDNFAQLGLERHPNGGSEAPRANDIIVFGSVPGNSAGHIAVVKTVNSDRVVIVEQNWNRFNGIGELRRRSTAAWDLYRVLNSGQESAYRVRGWLRQPASAVLATYSFSGRVTGIAELAAWQSFGINVQIGSVVSSRFTFNSTASRTDYTPSSPGRSEVARYDGAVTAFNATVSGVAGQFQRSGSGFQRVSALIHPPERSVFSPQPAHVINFVSDGGFAGANVTVQGFVTLADPNPFPPVTSPLPPTLPGAVLPGLALIRGASFGFTMLNFTTPSGGTPSINGTLDSLTRQ